MAIANKKFNLNGRYANAADKQTNHKQQLKIAQYEKDNFIYAHVT
jgi:hypothetical protein